MKWDLLFGLATILFFANIGAAQFPKIKVLNIKTTKSPTTADEVKNKTSMSAGKNRQMVIDDGFTFFDAKPV